MCARIMNPSEQLEPEDPLSKMRLPTRSLSTKDHPVERQIPVWQTYNAPLVEFTPLDDDTPGLTAGVDIWDSQSLLVVNLTCQRPDGQRYSVAFRPSDEEYLILRFGRSGRMVDRIGDEPADFLPGDVHLFRHSPPVSGADRRCRSDQRLHPVRRHQV
jgi:hypothetical protein